MKSKIMSIFAITMLSIVFVHSFQTETEASSGNFIEKMETCSNGKEVMRCRAGETTCNVSGQEPCDTVGEA